MGDLISRQKAVESLLRANIRVSGLRIGKTILAEYAKQCRDNMIAVIREMPGEEAEHVKHGAWILVGKTKKGSRILKCSYCGKERKGGIKSAYCMDCGAKMDLPHISDAAKEALLKMGENVHPVIDSPDAGDAI